LAFSQAAIEPERAAIAVLKCSSYKVIPAASQEQAASFELKRFHFSHAFLPFLDYYLAGSKPRLRRNSLNCFLAENDFKMQ
jgi:hypothetical protein